MKRISALLALMLLAFVVGALLLYPRVPTNDDAAGVNAAAQETRWAAEEARAFQDFPLFWLGDQFEDLVLKAILPGYQSGDAERIISVTFIYGDCDNSSGSCPVPLQVTNELLCTAPPGLELTHEEDEVRGIRPASYGGGNIRFSAGASIISILSATESAAEEQNATVRRAMDRLQPLNDVAGLAGDSLLIDAGAAVNAGTRVDCYRGQGDIREIATRIAGRTPVYTPTSEVVVTAIPETTPVVTE
jgi:hypothetical protein